MARLKNKPSRFETVNTMLCMLCNKGSVMPSMKMFPNTLTFIWRRLSKQLLGMVTRSEFDGGVTGG